MFCISIALTNPKEKKHVKAVKKNASVLKRQQMVLHLNEKIKCQAAIGECISI
jgi:hypothetical protein